MTVGIIVATPGIDALMDPVPSDHIGTVGKICPLSPVNTERVTASFPAVVAPLCIMPAVEAVFTVLLAVLAASVRSLYDDDIIVIPLDLL